MKKKEDGVLTFSVHVAKNVLNWTPLIVENKALERAHWAVTPGISGVQWKHILGLENLLCGRERKLFLSVILGHLWTGNQVGQQLAWADGMLISLSDIHSDYE